MQILLAFIVGAVVGIALHFLVPRRETRGVAIAPVLGALLSGAVWMALTWAGVGIDTPWPWLSAIVAPVLAVPVLVVLARVRTAHDARSRERLRIS